jgi:hypothetical protein
MPGVGFVIPDLSGISNLTPKMAWYQASAPKTGWFVLSGDNCPYGKVWLITNVILRWFNGGCKRFALEIRDSAGTRLALIQSQVNPVEYQGYHLPNPFMIYENLHLEGWFSITTANTTCSLGYTYLEFDWSGKLL